MANDYLYVLRPTRVAMLTEGPTADESAAVNEHFQHLQRATQAGVVRMAGRTQVNDARCIGLVVFVAESDQAAEAFMRSDPAVQRGVMTAELLPFRIALWAQA